MNKLYIIIILCLCILSYTRLDYSYWDYNTDLFNELFGWDNVPKNTSVSEIMVVKKPIWISNKSVILIDGIFEKIKTKLDKFNLDKKIEFYTNVNKKINTLLVWKRKVNKINLTYLRNIITQELEDRQDEKWLLKELFWDIQNETICNKWYTYIDWDCVKNEIKVVPEEEEVTKRTCRQNNGYGNQFWYWNYWSNCYIISCNEWYYLSNGTCLQNYNYCSNNNQHLENNYCVSNTRSCSINNGYGTQNWYSNYWSNCYATSCYSWYYLSNGNCIANYSSCSSNEHLENNYCISNTRNCSVNNGYGTQNWYGTYWSSCYANSCHNWYYLSNGSCVY